MSEKKLEEMKEWTESLLNLQRAPSQFMVLYHLLLTGKTLTVKEISEEISITAKATERAIAKLLEKNLIQRSPFRDGGYTCDSRQVILSLLMTVSELHEDYEKRR